MVRRREDGYHEVRMIMQAIHLYDLIGNSKDPGKIGDTDCFQPLFLVNEIMLIVIKRHHGCYRKSLATTDGICP